LLILLFLALAFLLGAFPLKDADFYWHLRTGDLIRATGTVPRTDLFTFTRAGTPWIDLHWLFQIAISWVHEHGGVVALNLAKCSLTCVAMLLLVTARRRDWPVWAMVLAWLPALLVLGGRMYVRPETFTLLCLAIFLAVISRWDRLPRLALLLPLVQVAWVNSHGLFVLGPILLAFGLFDAALRFGFFAPERRKWWRTTLAASVLTTASCLINPYTLTGALYPLELAGTMRNPIFSQNIAELQSIPEFIRTTTGFWNLPLQLHLATMALGALSFVLPLAWLIKSRYAGTRVEAAAAPRPAQDAVETSSPETKHSRSKRRRYGAVRSTPARPSEVAEPAAWRLSPFRLLLFLAFSALSLQATRNTHQFAAVVGTVTAWNFGEWAAALRRRRLAGDGVQPAWSGAIRRLIAFGAVALVLVLVGSGLFYRMTGEGRVVSLGEEPLFFPHKAVQLAGEPGMPDRFLSFHIGHASLFEYYHGPGRKVYTDPRLEVAGAELFKRYIDLSKRLAKDKPGWEAALAELGRPVIVVDHEHNWEIGATLLRSDHWRCVWFDAIAAVFVHDSYNSIVQARAVDFATRHFRPDPSIESRGLAELTASAKALRSYAPAVASAGGELARPLVWLGLDDARRLVSKAPDSFEGWKFLGQIELLRDPPMQPSARFRKSFDPVFDLSLVRATYALRRALELAPRDFSALVSMQIAYDFRLMHEAALPILDRMAALQTTNLHQSGEQAKARTARAEYLAKLGSPPATAWQNLSELDQIVTAQLAAGRADSAAVFLEKAYPAARERWEIIDRIATLRLHLGEPARARELWRKAASVPRPAVREARIGTTYLVEADFDAARRHYQQAIATQPDVFEPRYCLAVLEQDAGNALAAYEQARKAVALAADDTARSAARGVATGVERFARLAADTQPTTKRDVGSQSH
jgi:tetratricopeptide (TPR) repeat protein